MPTSRCHPRVARRRLARALAVLPWLAGCTNLTDPPLPDGARPLRPPAVYARWWAMTEACAGVAGSISDVHWIVVPNSARVTLHGHGNVAAYWSAGSNRIVLAEAVTFDGAVVRHEMLHALLRDVRHARGDFLERCGGVVACSDGCIRDAGPPPSPPAETPRVAPAALELAIVVDGDETVPALDDGHVAVVVTARNPAAHAVVVELPRPEGGWASAYRISLFGPAGGLQLATVADDAGLAHFAPGETKRQVFDFALGVGTQIQRDTLPGGRYDIRAWFGDQDVVRVGVSLTPPAPPAPTSATP